jgi:hypothetical protein
MPANKIVGCALRTNAFLHNPPLAQNPITITSTPTSTKKNISLLNRIQVESLP